MAEITALWQTDEVRRAAPTVLDEIQMGLDYSAVLFETIPELYAEIVDAIEEVYRTRLEPNSAPRLVRFGSWIGADYDGNPNVAPESTEYALTHARQTALDHYIQSLRALRRRLSFSAKRVSPSEDLQARLDEYEKRLEIHITDRADEPYRRFLSCMLFRVRLAMSDPVNPQAYSSVEEFASDLNAIRGSLILHKGERLARLLVDPLLRKLDTFGFHLYTLDVRQHARVHARAAFALRAGAEGDAACARDLLGTLRGIARLQVNRGTEAMQSYIVSGTSAAEDIISLYGLAN